MLLYASALLIYKGFVCVITGPAFSPFHVSDI